MNGWFPRINAYGDLLSGNAGIWLTKSGVSTQIAPAGTMPVWAGLAPVWNDTAKALTSFNGYRSYQAYNEYAGSDDFQWAGFDSSGAGRTDVFHNGNRAYPIDGACNLRFGGPRIAYLHPYQSEQRELIVNGGKVARGLLVGLAISHGGEVLIYSIATGTYTRQIKSEDGQNLSVRSNEAPIAAFLNAGQPWIVTQTHDVGTLVYPAFSSFGYQITGDLYYPYARMQGDKLRVVGSSSAGELREVWIDFNAPRTDLRLL